MFSIHFGYGLIDIFLVTLENFIYNLPSNNPFTRRGLVHPPRSMSMGSMSILLKHVKNRHPHSEIISHAIQQSKSCRQGSLSSPDLTSYGEMHWDLTSDIMPHIRWKLGGCLFTELYAVWIFVSCKCNFIIVINNYTMLPPLHLNPLCWVSQLQNWKSVISGIRIYVAVEQQGILWSLCEIGQSSGELVHFVVEWLWWQGLSVWWW